MRVDVAYDSPLPADAPFGQLFVVGAPRSGTTWLQRLLGSHPGISTGQETGLFAAYVEPWIRQWNRQLPDDRERWRQQRHKGLPALLQAEEFDVMLAQVVRDMHSRLIRAKPGARYVLDKDPRNSLMLPLIQRICPSARVVHIIRDGRDVASSMVAASNSWAGLWAPRSTTWAAAMWQQHVMTARQSGQSTKQYLEVRYEDLLAGSIPALAECFSLCDIEVSRRECEELFAQSALRRPEHVPARDPLVWSGEVMRRLGGPPEEPDGFFGEGRAGGWRRSWTAMQLLMFDQKAGDLLIELGYEPDHSWAEAPMPARVKAAAMRSYERSRGVLGQQLRQWCRRHHQ